MARTPIYDEHEVLRLLEQGLGPKAIAEHLAKERHIYVTPTAISMFKRRHGLDLKVSHKELLPWVLWPEHAHKYPAKMLRALSRRKQGLENTPITDKKLDAWLAAREANNDVVCYDPLDERGADDGFFYDKRRAGDEEFIRPPRRSRVRTR